MDSAYVRVMSLHLSRVLDEIGLNEVTIGRRRRTFLYHEKVRTICDDLLVEEMSTYHFGSQTEGATTPGLDSDLDTLCCYNNFNVIKELSEWQQDKGNLLMLHENTAPGYCRLQVLRRDNPVAREDLPDVDYYAYDDRGRVLLKNTVLNASRMQYVRNGPARSESNVPGFMDKDLVPALQYRSWPAQAREFIRRHRRYGWPTRRLLQKAVAQGVFLVAVGYKLSQTEPLEWRISASLAERCLMFSLSIVHIKCYVVLKMMVKTFLDPLVRKCISSYHCKTAVLYCTERNEAGFWREDNLLQCVQQCLVMLLTWVTDGFCPQYIMPEENLFAGKITVQNRDLLRSIFSSLVQSKGCALLRVRIDDLGHKLKTKLTTVPSIVPVLDSLATIKVVGDLEYNFHTCIHNETRDLLLEQQNTELVAAASSVRKKIILLIERLKQAADKLEQQAIQCYIEFLSSWLGSLLASMALSHKMDVPRSTMAILRGGAKSDISSMLILASVYYSSGDLCELEQLLQMMEAHFCTNEIQTVCECYGKITRITLEFRHMMFVLKNRKARAGLFAHCVIFTPQAIHCAPPAIRYELFRAVGDDVQDRHYIYDKWMGLAAVDCLPYLFYLQYLTYRQLRKRKLQTRAIHNLERCIRKGHGFGHLETTCNLLGQCREMEHEPEAAMACYGTSLAIRPRNNAAKWHIAILCYKAFLRRPGIC